MCSRLERKLELLRMPPLEVRRRIEELMPLLELDTFVAILMDEMQRRLLSMVMDEMQRKRRSTE